MRALPKHLVGVVSLLLVSGCGSGAGSAPAAKGSLDLQALWQQSVTGNSAAAGLQAGAAAPDRGGFGPEIPPSVRTVRVVFESDAGLRCCLAVNRDSVPGRLLVLDDLPGGGATVTIAGFATSFAPAVSGVHDTCKTDPTGLGEACDAVQFATPSFASAGQRVTIVTGAQTDADSVPIPAVPFLLDVSPAACSTAPARFPISFTIADAVTGVDPRSLAATLGVEGQLPANLELTSVPCDDATATRCSPGGTLGVSGFQVTAAAVAPGGTIGMTAFAGAAAAAPAGPCAPGSATQPICDALFTTNPGTDCRRFVESITVTAADPRLVQTAATYGASNLPRDGSTFLILGSGDPQHPAQGEDLDVPPTDTCVGDRAQVDIVFDIPANAQGNAQVQSLAFDFDFFSYEFPEFVGHQYNDYVFAYLDGAPVSFGDDCSSTPATGGCLLTRDAQGNITNVNSAFFQPCSVIGCDAADGTPGWSREYNSVPGDDAGRTGTLTTCSPMSCAGGPIALGPHTLSFLVSDVGDGVYTSVGLFDNLRCFGDPVCTGGTCPATCDDGDVCNGIETCGADNNCQSGTPLNCNDTDSCTVDTCDKASGCVHTPVACPTGQVCDPTNGECVRLTPTSTPTATGTALPPSPSPTPTNSRTPGTPSGPPATPIVFTCPDANTTVRILARNLSSLSQGLDVTYQFKVLPGTPSIGPVATTPAAAATATPSHTPGVTVTATVAPTTLPTATDTATVTNTGAVTQTATPTATPNSTSTPTACSTIGPSAAGSIVVFENLQVSATNDPTLSLANASNALLHAYCFYADTSQPTCSISTFDVTLPQQSSVQWQAGVGGAAVPGVPGVPFSGELVCVEVDSAGSPIIGNRLVGSVETAGQCPVAATSILGNPDFVPVGDTLRLDGSEYGACPADMDPSRSQSCWSQSRFAFVCATSVTPTRTPPAGASTAPSQPRGLDIVSATHVRVES